jgi:class 3 adenylate cyclase
MALAMCERAQQLDVGWRKRGHDLGMGIGIAQGYATIGAVGFEGRLDYGAIGTVTNLAARLCG